MTRRQSTYEGPPAEASDAVGSVVPESPPGAPAPFATSMVDSDRPPDGEPELDPGVKVGEYLVERKLGAGGMGQVYGAVHPLIHKRVAIKVLRRRLCGSPLMVQRFVSEARAVNRIGHPNIVDVFAFGTLPDGRHYSVMEWLPGEILSARLGRGRPALPDTLAILDEVCRALEAAHAEGIVHRDLKPDNVFLAEVRGERPRVKLLDFGIAKLLADDDTITTREGQVLGTPAYTSPEQARGRRVGPETDRYALGVMAYEMVLGSRPFTGRAAELVAQHLVDPPPPPRSLWPEVPARLEELLLALLAKEPADRPALAEVRAAIAELQGGGGGVVRARRRPRATLGLAFGVVGLVASGGAWLALRAPSAPAPRALAEDPVVRRAPPAAPAPAPQPAALTPASEAAMSAKATEVTAPEPPKANPATPALPKAIPTGAALEPPKPAPVPAKSASERRRSTASSARPPAPPAEPSATPAPTSPAPANPDRMIDPFRRSNP